MAGAWLIVFVSGSYTAYSNRQKYLMRPYAVLPLVTMPAVAFIASPGSLPRTTQDTFACSLIGDVRVSDGWGITMFRVCLTSVQ